MSDFQIDAKLDDSFFDLEPPRGYTLKKIVLKAMLCRWNIPRHR